MRIVIAPDKFKGTLSAIEAARAMERAVLRVLPGATSSLLPVADGGDGTLEVLISSGGGGCSVVSARGPWGDPSSAQIAALGNDDAFVEMAEVSRPPVSSRERAAATASSAGVGDLIARASPACRGRIFVGVGGSLSTDGGTGAASAVGWRFLDGRGAALPPGGAALVDLARIVPPPRSRASPAPVVGACDVLSPLTGPRGAALAFARQKGASPADAELLEEAMLNLAERARLDLGIDVEGVAGAGAGGGMGAGLVAFFGASLISGFDLVAGVTGLPAALARCGLVLTGEGRLDRQSFWGKASLGVARLARERGIPCLVVTGSLDAAAEELASAGVSHVAELRGVSERSPAAAVEAATVELLGGWLER